MTSPMVEAIATIVEAKDAEIDRLKAELKEAREIIEGMMSLTKHDEGAWYNLEVHKTELNRARAFLNRAGE